MLEKEGKQAGTSTKAKSSRDLNADTFVTEVPNMQDSNTLAAPQSGMPPSRTTPDLTALARKPLSLDKQREEMAKRLREDMILGKNDKFKQIEEKLVAHKAELVKKTLAIEDYRERQGLLKDDMVKLQERLDNLLDETEEQQKKLLTAAFSDLPDERYLAVQEYFTMVESSLQNRIGMLTSDLENERLTRLTSNSEQRARLLDKLEKQWKEERQKLISTHEAELDEIVEELNETRAELDLRPPIPDESTASIFTLANIKKKLGKAKQKKVPAPTGTVALLFTDVQDSTALWDSFGDEMAKALDLHNDLIRGLLPTYDGYEVKTEGDAFMVAFGDAVQALKCSLAIQLELMQVPWPQDLLDSPSAAVERHPETQIMLYRGLRIRMGLHWGSPICTRDVNTRRMDYFGGVVNLAARVGGAGHGGQLVVSQEFLNAVKITIKEMDVSVKDLGEHQLKGLRKLCHLHEVLPAQIKHRTFPLPNTVTTKLQEHRERDKELSQNYSGGAPPVGRVALVFTDVQDSTALWDRDADVMSDALDKHNDLMRQCIGIYGGFEVKTEGDAFMIAFSNAFNALAWCLAVQEKLLEISWPAELLETQSAAVEYTDDRLLWKGLRVRMGIHIGTPKCNVDPTLKRMDYFGPMVNLSARIGGAGHGGQIVISNEVRQDVEPMLEKLNNPHFADLGMHKLKGISQEHQLVQVQSQRLQARVFAPPSTVTSMMRARAERDAEMAAMHRQSGNPAPTGRVSLVFTDVQGSTSLWDDDPEIMSQSLDMHNSLMRDLIIKHKGFEVKTEGDAFMIAFGDPMDAIKWCLETQIKLTELVWPPELLALPAACEQTDAEGNCVHRGLRVRMGIHCGEPKCDIDPTLKRMDYYGPMVNLSARISGAGHGGQIVLSDPIAWYIENNYLALGKPQLTPLGEHRLKGIKKAEALHQLVPYQFNMREFPPPSTVTTALAKYEEKDSENRKESGVAPVGTVALVFTDVQNSTQLWDTDDVAMAGALAAHNSLMRKMIEEKNGYEVKTEGDAFMISFSNCVDAVSWCLSVQERLLKVNWDQGILDLDPAKEERDGLGTLIYRGLRVRMGVHWGKPLCDADPVTGRMDYHGPMVNLSARIGGAGHGGQIVISEAVLSQVDDSLTSDELRSPVVQSLGIHRLKGISEKYKLIQISPRKIKSRVFAAPSTVTTAMAKHAERDKMGDIGRAASRITPPTGVVSYVFTKIDGIDDLWDVNVDVTSEALYRHSAVIRKFIEFYQGYEVKKDESDGFFVAFAQPTDALRFCLAVQEEMLNVDWPPELLDMARAIVEVNGDGHVLYKGLRLKMGFHQGESVQQLDSTTRVMDYHGPEVTVSNMIAEAAHGGQILATLDALASVDEVVIPADSIIRQDLGPHRLKGVRASVHCMSVVSKELLGRTFPPPMTLTTQADNFATRDKSLHRSIHKRPPPTTEDGKVTLVVTDIPKSMELWEDMPDVMEKSLAIHHDVVRENIEKHAGYEVRTDGDAFLVAFETPAQAVDFGVDLQNQLLVVDWPEELMQSDFGNVDDFGMGVGVGIHTGKAISSINPETLSTEYMGPTVNEAAGLASAAHGGQILISDEVLTQMGMDLKAADDADGADEETTAPKSEPDTASTTSTQVGQFETRKLGAHRLDGMKKSIDLIQVSTRQRKATFPAPKTITTRSHQNVRRIALLESSLGSAFDALSRVKHNYELDQIEGDDLTYDPEIIRLEKLITDLKQQIVSAKTFQQNLERNESRERSASGPMKFAILRQDLSDIDEAEEDAIMPEKVRELQEQVRVLEASFSNISKQLGQFVEDQVTTGSAQPTPAEKLAKQQIDMLHFMVGDLRVRYNMREVDAEMPTLRHSSSAQTEGEFHLTAPRRRDGIGRNSSSTSLAPAPVEPSGSVVNMNFSTAMKMKNLAKSPAANRTASKRRLGGVREASPSSPSLNRLVSKKSSLLKHSKSANLSPVRESAQNTMKLARTPDGRRRSHLASPASGTTLAESSDKGTESQTSISLPDSDVIDDDDDDDDDDEAVLLGVKSTKKLSSSRSTPKQIGGSRSGLGGPGTGLDSTSRSRTKKSSEPRVPTLKKGSTSSDVQSSEPAPASPRVPNLKASSKFDMEGGEEPGFLARVSTLSDMPVGSADFADDITDPGSNKSLDGDAVDLDDPAMGTDGPHGELSSIDTPVDMVYRDAREFGVESGYPVPRKSVPTMGTLQHTPESLDNLNVHGDSLGISPRGENDMPPEERPVTRGTEVSEGNLPDSKPSTAAEGSRGPSRRSRSSRAQSSAGPSSPRSEHPHPELGDLDLEENLNHTAYKPPKRKPKLPQTATEHPYVVRELELYTELVALKIHDLALRSQLQRLPRQMAVFELLDWTPRDPDHINRIEEFMARRISKDIQICDLAIERVSAQRAANQQAAMHTLSCLIPIVSNTLGTGSPALSPSLVSVSEFGDRAMPVEPRPPTAGTPRVDQIIRRSQTIKTHFGVAPPGQPPLASTVQRALNAPTPGGHTPRPPPKRAVTAEAGAQRRGRVPPVTLPPVRGAVSPPQSSRRARTANQARRPDQASGGGEHEEWSAGDMGAALWPKFSSGQDTSLQ